MQFEEICRENYARIYNYILAKTADRETAEDITQDVFFIAFQRDAYEELCLQKANTVNEEYYRKQILQKLKPKERYLYQQYYVNKRAMKAIARELRISETALRMKYVRLRRKIRKIAADLKLDEF